MKRLCFLVIASLSISFSVLAQNDLLTNHFVPKITPPNVSAFQTVNLSNVNSYTGAANISIPVFNIQLGKINIPISIDYLSTGVKPNETSSNIGKNWSLNAGGSIIKIIKGTEDFSASFIQPYKAGANELVKYTDLCNPNTNNNILKRLGWLLQSVPFSTKDYLDMSSNCSDKSYSVADIINKSSIKRDEFPDLFIANAPGLSSKFTHRLNRSIMELEKQGNIITTYIGKSGIINFFPEFSMPMFPGINYTYDGGPARRLTCVNSIDITNVQGVKYKFNDLDVIQYVQRNMIDNVPNAGDDVRLTSQEISSYNLSSIEDTEGNKVEFIYEKYQVSQSEFKKRSSYFLSTNQTFSPQSLMSTEIKYPQLNRLKKIMYRTGNVEFFYTKSREDVIGDYALTSIVVRDIHNKIIKEVRLEQNYFISNNACSAPTCKNLKLEKIQVYGRNNEKLPPYQFTYNNTKLPERGSHYVDFLGYANNQVPSNFFGKSIIEGKESELIPSPILYFSPYKKRLSISPIKIYSDTYMTGGIISLASSKTYSKAGILEKVITPTGATQEYFYELNKFITEDGLEVTGGGLRIKKQQIKDELGQTQMKRYHYIDATGKSSGYLNNLPLYGIPKAYDNAYNIKKEVNQKIATAIQQGNIKLNIFSSPQTNIQLTNGSAIGYSKIIIEENNNGYEIQTFTSPKEFPIEEPAFNASYLGANAEIEIRYAYENGTFFQYFNNKDILLGKIKTISQYDNDNKLLSKKQMTYEYKVTETMKRVTKVYKSQMLSGVSPGEDYSFLFTTTLHSERNLNTKVLDTQFLRDKKISTDTKFIYDSSFPFVNEVITSSSKDTKLLVNRKFYPFQTDRFDGIDANDNAMNIALKNANRIGVPVMEKSFKKIGEQPESLLQTQRVTYKNFGQKILPHQFYSSKGAAGLQIRTTNKSYDDYGNLTSTIQLKGTPISFIWGYQNSLPIAKLENITYADIPSNIIEQLQNLSNSDVDSCNENTCTEESLRTNLNTLRSLFPNAMITTYTHDPFIGVTSITDNKGYTSYYTYDGLGRLKEAKDHDSYILSQYNYNFKNL
ncbi:YD repeat-containing protein [Aquimarina sp. MAR_2010_214]|uniref:RHS repeat domain-containing protein n=1 Tax=Aquimarina sp. MAR_2010_214 TaxID=1250026 RepID=UPI000C704056|nr:RHS repeat domain-containing protein [Aquimarina sp. MAR_2010_214]PKV52996.1 YD repeat-containing protein [Aquimarina sp. MAR_2010_214]